MAMEILRNSEGIYCFDKNFDDFSFILLLKSSLQVKKVE